MRVQMNTKIGGYRDGVEWPQKGGVIDVPDHEAAGLIANGYATPADEIEETDGADQGPAAAADGDGAADADRDQAGADDAGAEASAGDPAGTAEAEADTVVDVPAPVIPAKASKKR